MSKKKIYVIYTVQPGDSLGFIAKSHSMSLQGLLQTPGNEKYNKNPNLIQPNDKVVVLPTYTVGTHKYGDGKVYKTAHTLSDIAVRHSKTLNDSPMTIKELLTNANNNKVTGVFNDKSELIAHKNDLNDGDAVDLSGALPPPSAL